MREAQRKHRELNGQPLGVILAGGLSRRMGTNKATLVVGAGTLLGTTVACLQAVPLDVVVLGPEALQAAVPGVRVVPDLEPGRGPLAALSQAMQQWRRRPILLIGCDMPFLDVSVLRLLVDRYANAGGCDAVIPRSARGYEYLQAIYAPSCLPHAERLLAQGIQSLHALAEAVSVVAVDEAQIRLLDPTGRWAMNVNTPEQLARARDLLRETAC